MNDKKVIILQIYLIVSFIKLSKEMTEAYAAGEDKGLTQEELAFYDALVANS